MTIIFGFGRASKIEKMFCKQKNGIAMKIFKCKLSMKTNITGE